MKEMIAIRSNDRYLPRRLNKHGLFSIAQVTVTMNESCNHLQSNLAYLVFQNYILVVIYNRSTPHGSPKSSIKSSAAHLQNQRRLISNYVFTQKSIHFFYYFFDFFYNAPIFLYLTVLCSTRGATSVMRR